jgi:hypothetical protein
MGSDGLLWLSHLSSVSGTIRGATGVAHQPRPFCRKKLLPTILLAYPLPYVGLLGEPKSFSHGQGPNRTSPLRPAPETTNRHLSDAAMLRWRVLPDPTIEAVRRTIALVGLRDRIARGYPRMPRYFFHIANGKTFKDDLGELFLGVAEAMAHATDIAKVLGEDAGWRDCSVVVEDENGTEIGRVLVNED